MTISNTQVPYQNINVEQMVGGQKQEFPKPSIPAEDIISIPVEREYSAERNESKATKEAAYKNNQQTVKEEEMNSTKSLTDIQTTLIKAESTQNKIDAYVAGTNNSDDKQLEIQTTQDMVEKYQEIKVAKYKQYGMEIYQQHNLFK